MIGGLDVKGTTGSEQDNRSSVATGSHRMNTRSKRALHATGEDSGGPQGDKKCFSCLGTHTIYRCQRFIKKSVKDRRQEVRKNRLCFNCLGKHAYSLCNSERRCAVCNSKHHTLLHQGPNNSEVKVKDPVPTHAQEPSGSSNPVKTLTVSIENRTGTIILATAIVAMSNSRGLTCKFRALLDQGTECSFVSEKVVQTLQLKKRKTQVPLSGVGDSRGVVAKASVSFKLGSIHFPYNIFVVDALVLPQLTAQLPTRQAALQDFQLSIVQPLADPYFYRPGTVDIILGADVYGQLLRDGLHRLSSSGLVAQNTSLGWIISGRSEVQGSRRAVDDWLGTQQAKTHHCTMDENLSERLQRFWELEEVRGEKSLLSPSEVECENLFTNTSYRMTDGRFVVRLPVKTTLPLAMTETRNIAMKSLNQLHRRFVRDQKLADSYKEFMKFYEELGHMERVLDVDTRNSHAWYIPHHAVVQKSPWKLRVVFDASRKLADGSCLNRYLHTGPALQTELSLILTKWRKYRYAFTGDIIKMFRQILIDPAYRDYQRILWAPCPDERVVEYRLNTVTYGMNCVPYLAIRVLMQLARSDHDFPLGARCLCYNSYVDDVFAGSDDLSRALKKRDELVSLLHSAGMELDKWAANDTSLLPVSSSSSLGEVRQIDQEPSIKTLDLVWSPSKDTLGFKFDNLTASFQACTKRLVLSNIAKLFDPLGLLAPVIVVAKILLQDIWLSKCDWDSPLPVELNDRWVSYSNSLSEVSSIKVDRSLKYSLKARCELHGFSDTSVRAYAAVVYLRVQLEDSSPFVTLLMAKSKVSPVKAVSIPKLELLGATLLTNLVSYLQRLEFLKVLPVFMWSDSQIVLSWLKRHPATWKTFVANRVSHIQTELPAATWSFVPGSENPADLATRGVLPGELKTSAVRWLGPQWLSSNKEGWPDQPQGKRVLVMQSIERKVDCLLNRFSELSRLIRVVAYCLRPLKKLRLHKQGFALPMEFLSAAELADARLVVIRLSQEDHFGLELELLRDNHPLPKLSPLLKLNPFWDGKDRVMRVGGRLIHSSLSREMKHPPILHKQSPLSMLYVRHVHRMALHGGPTLTLSMVYKNVWILGALGLVKRELRICLKCQRIRPKLSSQLIGNLPSCRVTPSRPFSTCGLDYAGPFQVRVSRGRGVRSSKGYVALFICFATKAIHLELVGDLTTASFLVALRRFTGRRGQCTKIYSDNGTTFQGAARELKEMFNSASRFYKEVAVVLENDMTSWSFIPPNTPHCGGLWEAGVKSTKHHLKRIMACLNSRPLCPLTGDSDDLHALTPAHFLIGQESGVLPEADVPAVAENRLSRFQLIHRMRNSFWKRWSEEYLHHLQSRSKWRSREVNFGVGQLVTLRDDRYPPAKWPLGRVIELHPAADGTVRVVTIKTATSNFRRHISRLCPLYTDGDNSKKISNQD
ncbi:uncharacterized protein [Prorops nasuta]|uniref:uncharacterized protein n=1 Tax=Prorops nasuta TaxID=863751 RepID=UPI0034CE7EBE